jgi:CheY-like chemotaxis protein
MQPSSPVIVVVDDDWTVWRAAARIFPGFVVVSAGSVAEGLEAVQRHQVRAVLLDVNFGRRPLGLRALPIFVRAARGAPVVVMSGTYHREDKDLAVARGAWAYVEKLDLSGVAEAVALADEDVATALAASQTSAAVRSAIHAWQRERLLPPVTAPPERRDQG